MKRYNVATNPNSLFVDRSAFFGKRIDANGVNDLLNTVNAALTSGETPTKNV